MCHKNLTHLRSAASGFLLCTIFVAFSCGRPTPGVPALLRSASFPRETEQVLLMTVREWGDFRGTLSLCDRSETGWRMVTDPIAVVVGRNGLGWGEGLHESPPGGSRKVEGDGTAPAGIFELGPAYGYDPNPPPGCNFPYRQATAHDYFVDDVDSPDYNRWVSLADSADSEPSHHWQSFEKMRRDDDLYEWGVVIRHNMNPVQAGRGSAIFLHIWRGPDQPTAGCTAMSRENMVRVLRWLDPAKRPLLVQVPEKVLSGESLRFEP